MLSFCVNPLSFQSYGRRERLLHPVRATDDDSRRRRRAMTPVSRAFAPSTAAAAHPSEFISVFRRLAPAQIISFPLLRLLLLLLVIAAAATTALLLFFFSIVIIIIIVYYRILPVPQCAYYTRILWRPMTTPPPGLYSYIIIYNKHSDVKIFHLPATHVRDKHGGYVRIQQIIRPGPSKKLYRYRIGYYWKTDQTRWTSVEK